MKALISFVQAGYRAPASSVQCCRLSTVTLYKSEGIYNFRVRLTLADEG